MKFTGNKDWVESVIHECSRELREARNGDSSRLIDLYEQLLLPMPGARLLDKELDRIVLTHQDDWRDIVGSNALFKEAVDDLFLAIRKSLKGEVIADASERLKRVEVFLSDFAKEPELDNRVKEALGQVIEENLSPKLEQLHHDHKKQFNLLDTILGFMGIIRKNARFFNADRRFDGLEVLCQARRDQVRTAILHSWDNGYAILPIQTDPQKRAANKGRPTISSLARIMWSENGSKWMLVPDCYQSEAAYKTGLIEQAQRNPLSFNWIDED